jgi:DNA-binding NarL/FixJ family response regulator
MDHHIRIMVIDDHPIVRQGIRSLLSNYDEFRVVGEAENGITAMSQFKQQLPDVTLLDIRMPGQSGLEVLQQIQQAQPEAKVLMLSSFDDDEYVMQALRAGARGYILKSASDEMLVNTIRAVYQGEHVLSPQVTGAVVQRLIADRPTAASPLTAVAQDFDPEERQILRLLVTGASNSQIAQDLYLSHTTVKRKLRKIFTKMQVESRAQAAAEAVRHDLV